MITVSSHKIEGPKGVGALIAEPSIMIKKGLSPIVFGGGQELGMRSGTENVPGIAAFGEAVRIGRSAVRDRYEKMSDLRDYLILRLTRELTNDELTVTRPPEHAPNIVNVTAHGIKSETLLHHLSRSDIFVSSGSACSSNGKHSSSALLAYGKSEKEADSSIRISLSHRTAREELDIFTEALKTGISTLARVKK